MMASQGHAGMLDQDRFEDADGVQLDFDMTDDAVFEEEIIQQADFKHALGMTGLHHIIDNATEGLADVLPSFEENVRKAQECCRLLRRGDTRPKLLERCFSSALGMQLRPAILAFKGHIQPGRWGSLAFSIPELLQS